MSEIARAAGVSPAVISRVTNGDPSLRIREETRERVLRTVKRYDYAPNTAAKSLRTAETGLLALVVHDLSNPLHSEIASGARQEADRRNKSVILGEAMEMGQGLGRIEELIAGGGVDGLILQGTGSDHDRALARAARRWMPTILLQSGEIRGNATLIRLADTKAGLTATECLLELGHRKIGYLGVADSLPFSADRRKGWEAAMRKAGISPRERWSANAGSTFATGACGAANLIRSAPELTGIVVANVAAAVGALAKLTDLGRRVPENCVACRNPRFRDGAIRPSGTHRGSDAAQGTRGGRGFRLLRPEGTGASGDPRIGSQAGYHLARQRWCGPAMMRPGLQGFALPPYAAVRAGGDGCPGRGVTPCPA